MSKSRSLEEAFDSMFSEVSSNAAPASYVESPLLSLQQHIERFQLGLKEDFNKNLEEIAYASVLIKEKKLLDGKVLKYLESQIKKPQFGNKIEKCLSSSTPLSKLFKIPKKTVFKIYNLALEHLSKQEYIESASLFSYLCLLNPLMPNFWMGRGLSEEGLKEYSRASRAFLNAICFDPVNNLSLSMNIVNCLLQLEKTEMAKTFIQNTLKLIEKNEDPQFQLELKNALETVKSELKPNE